MCCMACVHAYVLFCVHNFTYHMLVYRWFWLGKFRWSTRLRIAIAACRMTLLLKRSTVGRPVGSNGLKAELEEAQAYLAEGDILMSHTKTQKGGKIKKRK